VTDAAMPAKLFPAEWWANEPISADRGVLALIDAVRNQLRPFAAATLPSIMPAVDRRARAATVRLYLRQLLVGSSGKLEARAAESFTIDIEHVATWCAEAASAVVDVTDGTAVIDGSLSAADDGLAAALEALDCTRRLMVASQDSFVETWRMALSTAPDAPLAVAEAMIARRPALAKAKKALTSGCQQAHAAAQTEAMGEWAGGHGSRPGAGAFSAALAGWSGNPRSAAGGGPRWPF